MATTSNSQSVPLPIKGQRNILITSALPYVNNVPHLGNIIGCVLSADVYARFCRARGYNVLYVCGTDEYGTATETKALEEKVTPQQICDKYHQIHKQIYEWLGISFDKFGRTSTQYQTNIAQDIFHKLQANELLLEDTIEQLYCDSCTRFLADRYVEGICPHCAYEDARGDQCDNCGKLLNPAELKEPRCKICRAAPRSRTTEHLFLDLPKLKPQLDQWVQESSVKGSWSSNSIQMTKAWIKEGLKPRCITRDLKWGTPVPLEKYKDKVFYVWFDAPIGYLSITASLTDEWEKWWKNPEDVELVQFMGKDNVPFHTVIFPSSLIGANDNYTMLHHISTTEYLNYEDGKFSKSRGVGVFGDSAMDTKIPPEVWRYYLLINRPEQSDTVFSWTDFAFKNNSELLANLGNWVNRALSFVASSFGSVLPSVSSLTAADEEFIGKVNEELKLYIEALEAVKIKEGLKICMAISRLGNQYWQDMKPWVLVNEDKARCGTVINIAVSLTKCLAIILEPYMPSLTEIIFKQLNLPSTGLRIPTHFELDIPANHKLGTPAPIFKKIEAKTIQELRTRFAGKQETTGASASTSAAAATGFPFDLRVGVVESIENHPTADKLYVVRANLGDETRQLVTGLRDHYPNSEELLGKKIVVVCNLKASELRGVESNGMILTAESKQKAVSILTVNDDAVEPGARLSVEGTPTTLREAKLDIKEFKKLNVMKTGAEGRVLYKTAPVVVHKPTGDGDSTAAVPVVALSGIENGKVC